YSGGAFDFLKMASSAGHTAGHTFISSETFISFRPDPGAITLDDLHLIAGRAFSAGINRIIYHGFPYVYIRENGNSWYPFIETTREVGIIGVAPFAMTYWVSEDHPVWPELPLFNRYMARLSYTLSRGTHWADVAWLHPERKFIDIPWTNFGGYPPEENESEISLSLKRAGLTYDRVSKKGLTNAVVEDGYFEVGAARYEVLLLTEFDVATPELMDSIEKIVDEGIPVFVIGDLPQRASGLVDWEERDAAIQESTAGLLSKTNFVTKENEVGRTMCLADVRPSIVPDDSGELAFAVVRRALPEGDILFLFNESNEDHTQILDINIDAKGVRILDPHTGELVTVAIPDESGQLTIEVAISAKRSLVLVTEH
ncbi:glycosyl hydrolase, partial [Chloroflexota bacterium]